MKVVLTILSALAISLTGPGFVNSAQAAGETGHSDLMRLLSAVYGLNIEVSNYLATVNQAVDNVPLSAATQSGRASAKLHFGTTVTPSDLDEKSLIEIAKNDGQRGLFFTLKEFFKNSTMGGGVASLSNAEAAEMLGRAMRNGDGTAFGMGLHYLLDVGAPFHDGYKGALSNPIPLVNKLPFLKEFAFGHLTDGTSPDRLSIGKIILAMEAMGPFLITLRETQKEAVGVNTKWLDYLKSQGVDIHDNTSIRDWFLKQDIVAETLKKEIPANKTDNYIQVIIFELKDQLRDLKFFNDSAYLDNKLTEMISRAEEYRKSGNMDWTVNKLIGEFIDTAWKDGKLNEREVIKQTTSDYIGVFEETQKLSDLLISSSYDNMPEYAKQALNEQLASKHSNAPHTREWLIDQIVAKITRGMISQGWEKFNTAYFNDNVESAQKKIEADALSKIEKHFFNRTGKYSYNPGTEYWSKIFQTWRQNRAELKNMSILNKVMFFCDLIVRTKIYEGYEVHSLNGRMKLSIFVKTMSYIFNEEFRNPITTKGNFAVKVKALRLRMIAQIRSQFPGGLITEEMIAKSKAYNDYVNAKFNSDKAVGVIQKTAAAVRSGAEYIQKLTNRPRSGAVLRCVELLAR